MPKGRGAVVGATLAGAVVLLQILLQVLGRTSGSTAAERARTLPGDDVVTDPTVVTNHARTIDGDPADVWPWLTQMGWHRAGWYTPRWVDRLLFPANWPSAEHLDPSLVRDLAVGDTVPDGPPGTAWFVVEHAAAPEILVLHSRTHLPPRWRERFGARLDWVWTFSLAPAGFGRTRLLIRNRGRVEPAWVNALYVALIVPADHVMATGMLRGLGRRTRAFQRPRRELARPGR